MVNPSVQKEWQKFVKEKATQRGFFDTTGASRCKTKKKKSS